MTSAIGECLGGRLAGLASQSYLFISDRGVVEIEILEVAADGIHLLAAQMCAVDSRDGARVGGGCRSIQLIY